MNHVQDVHAIAALIAAAVHDLDHPGDFIFFFFFYSKSTPQSGCFAGQAKLLTT